MSYRDIRYVKEAMDSYKIMISYVGREDTSANMLLLKWPDTMLAYMERDSEYDSDIATLICVPIKVLVEAMVAYQETKTKISISNKINIEIAEILDGSRQDPISAKHKLIRLCNDLIQARRESGEAIPLIKIKEEKDV